MAYEQPRVPIWREGNKLTDYIKELVRFLRSFAVAAWNADRLKDDEIKAIKALIESSVGGGGITVDDVHPVGSIYMSINETSPATLFGGTWESIGGRFLLGADSTYTAGSTGGQSSVKLAKKNIPPLSLYYSGVSSPARPCVEASVLYTGREQNGYVDAVNTQNTNPTPVSTMPPYLSVYMWKRTA